LKDLQDKTLISLFNNGVIPPGFSLNSSSPIVNETVQKWERWTQRWYNTDPTYQQKKSEAQSNRDSIAASNNQPKTFEDQVIENIKNKVTPTLAELRFQWLKQYEYEYSQTSILQLPSTRINKANRRTNKKIKETYSYVNGINELNGRYAGVPNQSTLRLVNIPPGVN